MELELDVEEALIWSAMGEDMAETGEIGGSDAYVDCNGVDYAKRG